MRYAPVHKSSLINVSGSTLSGIAVPSGGPYCCAISLRSAARLVAVVRADSYRADAKMHGLRHGWCGFSIELQHHYFVFADALDLSCYLSGRIIGSITLGQSSPLSVHASPKPTAALEDLISASSAQSSTATIEQYSTILQRLAHSMKPVDFVTFLYRFILNRDPDTDGLAANVQAFAEGRDPLTIASAMMESDEARNTGRIGLPSPFANEFCADFDFC